MKADVGMGAVGWKTAGLLKLEEGMVAALLETMEIKTEDQYATCLAAWRAGPTSLSG